MIFILIAAVLSVNTGLCSFSRFASRHEAFFTELFSLKHGVPCYQTLRNVLINISFADFNSVLFQWANHQCPLGIKDYISFDGNGLASTMTEPNGEGQNYLSLVSLFGQKSGLVYYSALMESKKMNEPEIVREILEGLFSEHGIGVDSLKLRLDAIYCQKKLR